MSDLSPATQRFAASFAKDAAFETEGLRAYRAYRDLGIAAATGGAVRAHVIRTTRPAPPGGSGLHYHDLDFQMVYVLKGWTRVRFEGAGEFRFEAGDCWLQPPRIRHHVLDFSDDYEVLEITLPADYETVQLPG